MIALCNPGMQSGIAMENGLFIDDSPERIMRFSIACPIGGYTGFYYSIYWR